MRSVGGGVAAAFCVRAAAAAPRAAAGGRDTGQVLSAIYPSEKTVKATLEFVDIAGLVAGASKGEGLGNKVRRDGGVCTSLA